LRRADGQDRLRIRAIGTVSQVDISRGQKTLSNGFTTLLRSTTMTYDDLGRRKFLNDPEAGESDRSYNAFG
jgi:hypothetical protein